MSEIAFPNFPAIFRDSAVIATRAAEVPAASFSNGANPAASNANGLGVATGVYGFKDQDFPAVTPEALVLSQYIGGVASGLECVNPTGPDPGVVARMTSVGTVAPDAIIGVVAGFSMLNKTGATIPALTSCFGWNTNA